MSDKEKIQWLDKFVRKLWNQGDNYYINYTKKNVWIIGYTNDYPLQHGTGQELRLPDDVVEFLIKHTKI